MPARPTAIRPETPALLSCREPQARRHNHEKLKPPDYEEKLDSNWPKRMETTVHVQAVQPAAPLSRGMGDLGRRVASNHEERKPSGDFVAHQRGAADFG
jgi:hypothetical protein